MSSTLLISPTRVPSVANCSGLARRALELLRDTIERFIGHPPMTLRAFWERCVETRRSNELTSLPDEKQ